VPGSGNFTLQVTEDFDWYLDGTISMLVPRTNFGTSSYHACQLRIFTHDNAEFFVTATSRQEPEENNYLLVHYLEALKYLPQEHIRSMIRDNPAGYQIILNPSFDYYMPSVFYNRHGLTYSEAWTIALDIYPLYAIEGDAYRLMIREALKLDYPLYAIEGNDGYMGLSSDVIRLFYVLTPEFELPRTFYLEGDEDLRFTRLSSITLHHEGRARLATPPISSYAIVNPVTYTFAEGELWLYYENQFDNPIARFEIVDEYTLVFIEATVPLFADAGARYVAMENTATIWGRTRHITLDDIRTIAQSIHENMTMDDLSEFIGTDVGSGILIMQYLVENTDYILTVGSNDGRDVAYALLTHATDGGTNASIDIRYYDVGKFLADGAMELVRPMPESDDTAALLDERVDLGCCVTGILVRETAYLGANSATHAANDFIITLNSDKLVYTTSDIIRIWGTLEYVGEYDTIEIWSGCPFMIFTVAGGSEIDFGGVLGTATTDVLVSSVLERGKAYHFVFQKSGGYSADDPDAEFWRMFFSDERLIMPTGEYSISLYGAFSLSESISDSRSGLMAELTIVVLQ
jgi:hypothetical protein